MSSQNLDEPLTEASRQVVGLAEVSVERGAIELRQHIHLVDVGVDAVADRNINQSVLTSEWHCGLRPHFGEGVETRSCAPPENDGQNALHAAPADRRCGANLPDFSHSQPGDGQDPPRMVRISSGLSLRRLADQTGAPRLRERFDDQNAAEGF